MVQLIKRSSFLDVSAIVVSTPKLNKRVIAQIILIFIINFPYNYCACATLSGPVATGKFVVLYSVQEPS